MSAADDGRELAALLTPRDDQNLAARGAGGVGTEPGVYAAEVEAMAALRQHPDLVPLRELRQADRTFRRKFGLRGGSVGEFGERLQDLLLQALIGRRVIGRRSRGTAEPGAASHRY